VSKEREDSRAAYIPERYREQIQAKKQQRLIKKLVIYGAVGIIALLALFLGVSLVFPAGSSIPPYAVTPTPFTTPTPEQSVTPLPTSETTDIPEVQDSLPATEPVGTSAPASPDTVDISSIPPVVIDSLRSEFPATGYILLSANGTARYSGQNLYEIRLRSTGKSDTDAGFTVFYNATSGEPYTPGQEKLSITLEKAREIAGSALPSVNPDTTRFHYSDGSWGFRGWNFAMMKDKAILLDGNINADTGEILMFSRTVNYEGRPAEPVLDRATAEKNAGQYIADHNGPVEIRITDSRYSSGSSNQETVAGSYLITYKRMVQDYPCDQDGFEVTVDSVTGEITGYKKTWNDPDFAFSLASEPVVLKRDAIYSVLNKAQELNPAQDAGLQVVSSELVWRDQHQQGTTPRPGSISIAWKIRFDDESLRDLKSMQEAVGWVDPQTGTILKLEYPL
jgi:hypothetical protein